MINQFIRKIIGRLSDVLIIAGCSSNKYNYNYQFIYQWFSWLFILFQSSKSSKSWYLRSLNQKNYRSMLKTRQDDCSIVIKIDHFSFHRLTDSVMCITHRPLKSLLTAAGKNTHDLTLHPIQSVLGFLSSSHILYWRACSQALGISSTQSGG